MFVSHAAHHKYHHQRTHQRNRERHEGLQRAKQRGAADRFEAEILAFHERVRDKYLEIAKDDPARVKVIESVGSIEDVQERIRKLLP